MSIRAFRSLLTLVGVALMIPGQALANGQIDQTPATIKVGMFGLSLPMIAQDAKGFNAAQHLTVEYERVQSSQQQFQSLASGDYDVVQTSPDNVANYRLNSSTVLGAPLDAQFFVGFDYGLDLVLVTQKGISSVEDLRGKILSVDAPDSGFAFVLYEIMKRHGMTQGVDYQVVSTGGVFQRFQALLAGQVDGTLLSSGFEVRARLMGFPLFDNVQSFADPYLGSGAVARESWLKSHHDVAVRYITAYYEALKWSMDPANKDEAIALLASQPNTTPELAAALYEEQMDPSFGNIPDAQIEIPAMFNVLDLRNNYGGFDDPQNVYFLSSPASGIYDFTYYLRARVEARRDGVR